MVTLVSHKMVTLVPHKMVTLVSHKMRTGHNARKAFLHVTNLLTYSMEQSPS